MNGDQSALAIKDELPEKMIPRRLVLRRKKERALENAALGRGLSRLQAHVLAGRLDQPQLLDRFLEAKGSHLDSYKLLEDIEKAASRIGEAIKAGETIACFSDYDADGLGANACFRHVMGRCIGYPEQKTISLVGNRLVDGYGLTDNAVQQILGLDERPTIVITADCGSADEPRISKLAREGISVVVTDHHHIPIEGPNSAFAFINPQRKECNYPDKFIAGGMVLWLLMWATRDRLRETGQTIAEPSELGGALDFVACSTVADCVSLASVNNRAIVRQGLKLMNEAPRPCWKGIAKFLKSNVIDEFTIGFEIASRINARTRLDEPLAALDFLTSSDDESASRFAAILDEENTKRKAIEKCLKDSAMAIAEPKVYAGAFSLSVLLKDGHAGVQGICAARVVERFGLPAFIFSPTNNDEEITGSGRSIEAINLKAALDAVNQMTPTTLVKYGGHAAAAGATIRADSFEDFERCFEYVCREMVRRDELGPRIYTDGSLAEEEISLESVRELDRLGPYGRGFEAPVFDGVFEVISVKPVGDGTHLQLTLMAGSSAVRGIWFRAVDNAGDEAPIKQGEVAKLLYQMQANTFRGTTRLQLIIRDRFE